MTPPPNHAHSHPKSHGPSAAQINAVVVLFTGARYAEAAALAGPMTQRFPGHEFGWKMLAAVLTRMGRHAEALEPMQRAAALSPRDAEAHSNLGVTLKALGRLQEAEASLRQALAIAPSYVQAHYNLGNTLQLLGRLPEALASLRQAIELSPDYAQAHFNLGNTLQAMGHWQEAKIRYQHVLRLKPDHLQACLNLSQVLTEQGDLEEAAVSYRRCLQIQPDCAEAHSNRGHALHALGRLEEAEASCLAALRIKPGYAAAYCNLGNTLHTLGRLDEAESAYTKALQIEPRYAEAHSDLGNTLFARGHLERALASYQRALEISPALVQAHSNLANTLQAIGRPQEAEASCLEAVRINPNFAENYSNLGNALQAQARLDEAIASYRQALKIKPNFASAYSNLLFTLNYHPDLSAEEIFEAYRGYERQFALPHQASWRAHGNNPTVGRRLRVGYVSPEFRSHACRHFLEPLLARHDPSAVEVFAYAELACEDAVSLRYKAHVAHWVPTRGLSDAALAERIRADAIDILVDVAGHTGGNRLQVFARKPAPVSLHWLDFGYTTGLSAIDYYLSDWTNTPAGSEALFGETPWRLDGAALVYRPAEGMGRVSALPATTRGYITFGSLTRGVRINHRTLRAWASILSQVPGSKLIVDSRDFRSESAQDALAQRFMVHGIARDRLRIGCHSPPWDVLREIDIALDCFPHNSGTTLFEGLYLGVPFVTVMGRPSVGRLGASILQAVGLSDWIAQTEEEYVRIAVAMAADRTRLAAVRAGLRSAMEGGPLMDEAGFARRVERAYQLMFKAWAEQKTSEQPASSVIGLTTAPATVSLPPIDAAPTPAAINAVVNLFSGARYAEAAALALPMTRRFPGHEFGWKMLAAVLTRMGRHAEALEPMQRAAALSPGDAEAHSNLGVTLKALGRLDEAEASFQKALMIAPGYAQAHYNLGNTLQARGQWQAAQASLRRAIQISPDYAQAHYNLGNVLQAQGQLEEAALHYRQALRVKPDHLQASLNLSHVLKACGQLEQAASCCRDALKIAPDFAPAIDSLGSVLHLQGRMEEAESHYRRAIEIDASLDETHNNLGSLLSAGGRPTEAEASYRKALQINPDYAQGYNNLANLLRDQGRLIESLSCCQRARTLKPDLAQAHSNLASILSHLSDFDQVATASNTAQQLQPNDEAIWEQRLYSFSYHPDLSAQDIYAEFLRWGERFPDPVTDFSAHDRSPGRRLRIGYVSPDFRRHTSCFFFWPLLANHDPSVVELFAYSNVGLEDEVTQDFKGLFPHWRAIRGVPDAEVARLIQDDQIDILVDCCNHMRDARLGVFALKPAPIQATWLGAAWTTGLKAVDYALIDPYMAPAGTLTRETIVRLPHCFVAYRPPEQTADLAPSPCLKNGHITFGYSGRSERLNHHTFRVWGEILQHNPSARLILDFRTFADPQTQAHYRQFMARHGLNPSRVTLRNSANIFQGLNDIDVLLDSFPHSGGTMLFDALWMGVPVLTLASRPPVGRIGTSLMMNLGLPDWVAHSHAEYIAKAKALTQDVPALASLRAGMRQRLQASPIMDGVGFARGVEAAYGRMFETSAHP